MSQQVYRVLLLGESWAHVPTGRAEQAVSLLRGHSGELAEGSAAFHSRRGQGGRRESCSSALKRAEPLGFWVPRAGS